MGVCLRSGIGLVLAELIGMSGNLKKKNGCGEAEKLKGIPLWGQTSKVSCSNGFCQEGKKNNNKCANLTVPHLQCLVFHVHYCYTVWKSEKHPHVQILNECLSTQASWDKTAMLVSKQRVKDTTAAMMFTKVMSGNLSEIILDCLYPASCPRNGLGAF